MIRVHLTEKVAADIVEGVSIQGKLRWSWLEAQLLLGPYYSFDEWETHRVRSIGSIDLTELSGSDELLFRPDDRLLWGVSLNDCNHPMPYDTLPIAWDTLQPTAGVLRLIPPTTSFLLDHREVYWATPNGDAYVCLYDTAMFRKDENTLRLRLARNIDLLFAEGWLCGWMLSHPARYLGKLWKEPETSGDTDDDELSALLYDCIGLVDDTHMINMATQDPVVLQELRSFLRRLRRLSGSGASGPRQAIQEYLEYLIETYYS